MIYVLLVDGFEEIEAIEPIDILRRGGLSVKTVGVNSEYVKGAHDIVVKADILIDDVSIDDAKLLMLPGGAGHINIEKSEKATELIKKAYDRGNFVAAICASPSILGKMGLLKGKKATCFPGFEEFLEGAVYLDEKVVRDGKIITAKGAGAASDFGFCMLEALRGKKIADEIKEVMQY